MKKNRHEYDLHIIKSWYMIDISDGSIGRLSNVRKGYYGSIKSNKVNIYHSEIQHLLRGSWMLEQRKIMYPEYFPKNITTFKIWNKDR